MKKIILCFSLIISYLCFINVDVNADENDSNISFTIEGLPNDKQIDENVPYYHLKEEPGEKDQITIKLINNSDREISLETSITNANTNLNGLMDYTGTRADHASLKIPLTSILTCKEKIVKVPAKSSVNQQFDISMPSEKFDGVIIGGIVVAEKNESKTDDQSLSLNNEYKYTMGVVLTNQDDNVIKKNISLILEEVSPKLFDGKKTVEANILNDNPYIFSGKSLKAKIYSQENNDLVNEISLKNISIAPHSSLPVQFDWGKADLKSGNYIFKGNLIDTDGKEWKFEKNFVIKAEEAKSINEKSVFKVEIPSYLATLNFCIIIITLILTTVHFYKYRGELKL
ncbi:DUF916 and DUF3324 domain-containing protein [Enterococcus sp. DIV0660C]|uniref:DUF916 and DUF3324 domain-containing protein n=1 Tax=Enterococcus sp. DIV0660C TaxID=2230880 RepID=UPI001A8C5E46|nr:DUF916 and DUF3324 domain-containing protein [Enterococcus sp. DIV0660C]MBO0431311.1 DUF916 and DUF3324 domain-containing protein [Enterococcus sp. DIV0660C]